jgi:ThiF family
MECTSEFRELASHNPFIKDLEELGYHADFINGYFVLFGLPYLEEGGALNHGDWVSPVDLQGQILNPPSNHQAWFRGQRPYDQNGRALRLGGGPDKVTVCDNLVTDQSFSFKLAEVGQLRSYASFEEKVTTYVEVITAPAIAAYPQASPLRGIEIKAAAQGSPLKFPDTMSARYNINDISALLRGKSIAIIGVGGTGSYILDFVARTHLETIVLYDDDKVHVHTIFRMPGFIEGALGRKKVEALAQVYSCWHAGIKPVTAKVTLENIEDLRALDFVFVSVDDGPSRLQIVDWLSSNGIPFVDCGMGLNRSLVGLNGVVRITGVDRAAFERTARTPYLPAANLEGGEYRKQAQITEFNALNAAFAVLRFKQHFKLLDQLHESAWHTFESASFELDGEVDPP